MKDFISQDIHEITQAIIADYARGTAAAVGLPGHILPFTG